MMKFNHYENGEWKLIPSAVHVAWRIMDINYSFYLSTRRSPTPAVRRLALKAKARSLIAYDRMLLLAHKAEYGYTSSGGYDAQS